MAQTFVTRFAPSPTGYLHRGHAYSALTAFDAARAAAQSSDARFLLRIEDIDATRCRPEYEAALLEDLAWLGLTWETPVRRQSDHLPDYDAALQRLRDAGLAYRCFKTRKEIAQAAQSAPHGLPPPYTGAPLPAAEEATRLAAGQPFAWRLSLAAARQHLGGFNLTVTENGESRPADPTPAGDIVLARKDVGVAYHL
ncbi:MAG: tRNA glutamyl-Q(34) synthetase GluQRS, partial [Caulobacter sp.]|nr:tRNA glutamyl-Q(34) synthetase GluQRS [Caulobacter sp.]